MAKLVKRNILLNGGKHFGELPGLRMCPQGFGTD